jgi:hypothetical protein
MILPGPVWHNLGTVRCAKVCQGQNNRENAGVCKLPNWITERTGFEPAVGFDPYADLANRCYRPLSHLS